MRTERTDRMLITGERHLRVVLNKYTDHYNQHRPPQSRQLQPPQPLHNPLPSTGSIHHRAILGGLLNEYRPTKTHVKALLRVLKPYTSVIR